MEAWRERLEAGDANGAWTLFIARYHRLIDATVRRVTREHDDVLDAFAHVCESLCGDDFARLRRFRERAPHGAKFSTWLVAVARNLAIDWLRAREGRPRLTPPPSLSPFRQRIYQKVLVEGCSHAEAYELLSARDECGSFGAFLREVRETYQAVDARRWAHLGQLRAGLQWGADERDDSPAEGSDAASRVRQALSVLRADEAEAIRLFIVEEQPAEEVARAVGWPNAKAVYNRVRRALATARAAMQRADDA